MRWASAAAHFAALCQARKPSGTQWWDVVCLLAADEPQQRFYEGMLHFRRATRLLPPCCEYLVVVACPHAMGSSGRATDGKQAEMAERILAALACIDRAAERRILVVDGAEYASPLLPHLNIKGTLFAPLPPDARVPGLPVGCVFDYKMISLAPLAQREGIFVTSADISCPFDDTVQWEGCASVPLQDFAGGGREAVLLDVLAARTERGSKQRRTKDWELEGGTQLGVCSIEDYTRRMLGGAQILGFTTAEGGLHGVPVNKKMSTRVLASTVRDACNLSMSAAVLGSSLTRTHVDDGAVVEFSRILGPAGGSGEAHQIGRGALVSSVFYHPVHDRSGSDALPPLMVPPGVLLMSCATSVSDLNCSDGGQNRRIEGFATFFFGIGDDLSREDPVQWCGVALQGRPPSSLHACKIASTQASLLTQDLFAVHADPTVSVALALRNLHEWVGNKALSETYDRFCARYPPAAPGLVSVTRALEHQQVQSVLARLAPLPGPALQAAILRLLPPVCMAEPCASATESGSCVVELPARLVVAGGWSDTPPMSLLRSGAVVNMACLIAGQAPLRASVTRLQAGAGLQLVSKDQEVSRQFESWDNLYDELLEGGEGGGGRAISHASSVAVHAACVAAMFDSNLAWRLGVSDSRGPQSVFPVGVELSTHSLLPKGSGLGGSSILALACVRALAAAFGRDVARDVEMDTVLAVEQVLGTGGGWQDQIGATTGVKLTQRHPGGYQVERVHLSCEHAKLLQQRLVCLGTAMTRVAKTVLVGVVDKFCYGHAGAVDILCRKLQDNALAMHAAMIAFSKAPIADALAVEMALQQIGEQLLVYRSLCTGLQGAAFLPDCLAPVFDALDSGGVAGEGLMYGSNLMGAGSGGFVLGVLKEGCTGEAVLEAAQSAVLRSGNASCVSLSLEAVDLVL